MRLELRREEETLDSREMPPESHLLRMVEDLLFKVNNGGPIMERSFEDLESGRIEL